MAIRREKTGDGGLYVGLNSGTSADRIDACLVRLPAGSGRGGDPARALNVAVLTRVSVPIPRAVRSLLLRSPDGISLRDLCRIDAELGERFGRAAARAIASAGIDPARVRAAGLHGQTVCHLPAARGRSTTLQIGSPERVALAAGVPVVSDFRQADTAAGGEGAPLSPVLDHALFLGRGALVLNIGGIANLTAVPRDGAKDRVRGLDVGPGNMLLDGVIRLKTGGRLSKDAGGLRALRGRADQRLLAHALAFPSLARRRTRSLGREELGEPFLAHFMRGTRGRRIATEDLLATAAAVTAESAWRGFLGCADGHEEYGGDLWICGGGIHNRALVRELSSRFAARGIRVRPLSRGGVSAVDRECVLFAFLAREHVGKRPGNLPSVTGALRPVVLGRWTPRPPPLRRR